MSTATNRQRSPWAATRRGIFSRLHREEAGQSLILVMMISIMATLMVTTATTALTTQIRPAAASVSSGEATAAAQAGLESFLSWVNTNCPPNSGFLCAALTTGLTNKAGLTDPSNQRGVVIQGGDGVASTESYWWTVSYAAAGFARVKSVGQVPTNKTSPAYTTKTLVADVNATPSFNNFQYYTKFETYASDFVDGFYQPRTVQVTSAADQTGTSLASINKPGTLSWAGACDYVDATSTPGCDPNHSTNICDDLYYPSSNGPGRGTDTAWNNGTRRPSASTQAAMGTDSSFAYYSEGGTFTPTTGATVPVTHNDTCDSSMEPNMIMNGPVYSQDAYLIDRGKDTGQAGPSEPNFDGAAFSVWNGTINGVQQPLGANGGYDRAYPGTDGEATLTSNYPTDAGGHPLAFPIYQSNALELPPNASDALPLAQCVYTGPTRILIDKTVAHITSPLTPAGASACYQSTGSYANVNTLDSKGQSTTDPSGGVIDATVPLSRTLIYIKNPDASVQPTTATVNSPIFDTATNLVVPPTATSDGLTGTWTDDASYLPTAPCPTPANATKRRNFDCETGKTAGKEDVLTNVKAAVDAALNTTGVTETALTAAITAQLSTASQAAGNTLGSAWYTVTVPAGTTTSTQVVPGSDSTPDPFLQTKAGVGYKTTTTKWTATISRTVCTATKKGACSATTTAPLVQGVLSKSTSAANTGRLNAAQNFPWFGAQPGDGTYNAATTYTDPNNDVTQYSHGYGDAYVEGTTNANLSIVAEHDIVITNDLTYGSTDRSITQTTSYGLSLVATHNVRIYRPMTCTDNGTAGATSPGFCPNDFSGVYTGALSWPLPSNYPSDMYQADNAPSLTNGGTGNIYAAIFTLRGSFMADNFYRGANGSNIDVYGGLYQYHRGATSLPYQGRPYQGDQNKMPGILVTYNYDNLRAAQAANGGLRVPYIPPPDGRLTNNTWNIISISTGS